MKLTCSQMDVLISFYLDGDLSKALKSKVEEHLKECPNCQAKFDIIKSVINDFSNVLDSKKTKPSESSEKVSLSTQYRLFKNNLSAYVDNELPNEESLKLKKYTINNKHARKDLEETYTLRRMINESFKKASSEVKTDYSKNVLKMLELEEEATSGFHPAIKLLIVFTLAVLVVTSIVLMNLSV